MSEHDFEQLFDLYPEIIGQMDDTFTSHKFILHLAREYQALYITALYAYISLPSTQQPTPFKTVHGILAKHLNAYPELVTNIGEVESFDIFTNDNRCAQWQKVLA
ncbi:hypothetical protein ES703_82929 [subsurface metagenome]